MLDQVGAAIVILPIFVLAVRYASRTGNYKAVRRTAPIDATKWVVGIWIVLVVVMFVVTSR
jgi:hypothetical protein